MLLKRARGKMVIGADRICTSLGIVVPRLTFTAPIEPIDLSTTGMDVCGPRSIVVCVELF